MKRAGLILVAAMALAAMAEQAEVRVLWGTPKKTVRAETRRVELERLPDGAFRAVVRKGEIPADAFAVEVVPDFMKARKGEPGYWIQARGTYGEFDQDDGVYAKDRQLLLLQCLLLLGL